jgi:uncharacterized protein YeaO (DUF488 family)
MIKERASIHENQKEALGLQMTNGGRSLEMIKAARVYGFQEEHGYRILVDRLWPRGVSKEDAKLDLWLKEIGPSNELRKWFGHDPERWNGFKEKFFSELDEKKELVEQIIIKAREGDVVLLFGAKDEEHNNAVALKEYIESKMGM